MERVALEIPLVLFAQGGNAFAQYAQFLPLIFIGILFYFLLVVPNRRKEQEHRNLLSNLKKDDRIVTIGGIYGVVSNVRRDADRVTIKVDETTNAKIDITFAAVARIVNDGAVTEKAAK